MVRVGSRFSGRALETLMASYDVSLMWTRADVAFADIMNDSITNFDAWQAHK